MSQMTRAVVPSNGTPENERRKIVKRSIAEMTGSLILDWSPEEFGRTYQAATREDVEAVLAD